MQRLALRVLKGDVDAAIVLGDMQQEQGLPAVPTGRARRADFLLNGNERVTVPAREIITGLAEFAADPRYSTWSRIKVSYVTLLRDVFRQLRHNDALPIRIRGHLVGRRFADLRWDRYGGVSNMWQVYDDAVKTRLFNPVYVGSIERVDVAGPRQTNPWSLQRVRPSKPLPID